jgi:ABC-type Na+ efflux pump permease subunit
MSERTASSRGTLTASATNLEHRAFSFRSSFGRILAITTNTLTELTRQKVFYVLLIFALILIGSSIFVAKFTFQQEFQILKDVSLGAMSIFSSLLAIVATARLIPQDMEDRTLYTILAKPVPRYEYILGKLLGVLLLLAISIAVMAALSTAILYFREQSVLDETWRQMHNAPPGQLDDASNTIRASGLNSDMFIGFTVIFLRASILAALTLFISTFATTNIFTIVVMVFVYFIGHFQATAREYWLQQPHTGWLDRGFLALVALIFPDLQAFNLVDDLVAGVAIPMAIFMKTMALGFFYIAIYTVAATFVFYGKEL